MRIVDVPFAYTLSAVPSGSIVPRRLPVRDAVPVRVEEVGAREAPVAATIDAAGAGRRVWRQVGGRLLEERRDPLALVPHGSPLLGGGDIPLASEVALRRLDGSDHSASRAAAVAHAETCLAFGKGFLVPSPGPCVALGLVKGAYGGRSRRLLVMDPRDAPEPYLVSSVARMDEFWEWAARSHAMRGLEVGALRATIRVDGEGPPSPGVTIDVSIPRPDALGFDVEGLCLVMAARHVFDTGLTNRMLGAYPSAFLEGWLAFRNGSVDPEVADERLAEVVRAAGLSGSEVRRMDETDQRLGTLLDVALAASERWDVRWGGPAAGPAP